jgi:hypothetical protein
MNENEFLQKLRSLLEQGDVDEGLKLLQENTGKGKIIDPSDTPKIEKIWSSFANPFLLAGQLDNFLKICQGMDQHLSLLQQQENARYHKGWAKYSLGLGFLHKAFYNFLLSFIEDTISLGAYPENALSTASLQGIFKVDSEFLRDFSQSILEKESTNKEPNRVLQNLGVKAIPVELWTLEYQMQKVEKKLREFIEKRLSNVSQEWWEKLVPEEVKKDVDSRITTSSKVLWFSEQPTSPLEYLSFPQDYIKILTCDSCWPHFKSDFPNKAILSGRLEGLGHIRHKIAHYRKVSNDEKQMFEKAIYWLHNCVK